MGELVMTNPIESPSVKALVSKKLIDLVFSHGDELYVVKLCKEIFTAVDEGLKRGAESLG